MGRLTAYVLRSFHAWDSPSRYAFSLAMILLFITLLTLMFGPENLRSPALVGFIGLVIVVQGIFMWGNRGMVTPFTLAQRFYLAEDFDSARRVLEESSLNGRADVQTLTLLGNTYRQLGMINESEEVLTKALELRPFDHFPLYGIGRTLLVKGQYAQAAVKIKQALDAGAPEIIQLDLGETFYRLGEADQARQILESALHASQEPHRELMSHYLLYQLGVNQPPTREQVQLGLRYWQENAVRFQGTPYGQRLAEDVQQMQAFMEES